MIIWFDYNIVYPATVQVSLLHTSLQATTSTRHGDTEHWLAAMETVVIDTRALEQEYCQSMEEFKFDEAELMVSLLSLLCDIGMLK